MKNTLEEVTAEKLNAAHVRRRVRDWKQRITALYAQIGQWLPPGWTAKRGKSVIFHAPLMKAHGLPATTLPALELRHSLGQKIRIVPDCLWIVGLNGRLDLLSENPQYFIADTAGIFKKPRWRMMSLYNRAAEQPLNGRIFKEFLNNEASSPHHGRLRGGKRAFRAGKSLNNGQRRGKTRKNR